MHIVAGYHSFLRAAGKLIRLPWLVRLPATPSLPDRWVRNRASNAPSAGCPKTHPPAACISLGVQGIDEVKESRFPQARNGTKSRSMSGLGCIYTVGYGLLVDCRVPGRTGETVSSECVPPAPHGNAPHDGDQGAHPYTHIGTPPPAVTSRASGRPAGRGGRSLTCSPRPSPPGLPTPAPHPRTSRRSLESIRPWS